MMRCSRTHEDKPQKNTRASIKTRLWETQYTINNVRYSTMREGAYRSRPPDFMYNSKECLGRFIPRPVITHKTV